MKILRFLPAVASFLLAAGLQVSGYQNAEFGLGVMILGFLLLGLAAYPWLSRVRVRFYLRPRPVPRIKASAAAPNSPTQPAPSPSEPTSKPLPGPSLDERVKSIARLIWPLPQEHLSVLRRFSSGPACVSRDSAAVKSLSGLKLIRFVGRVDRDRSLYEATDEEALKHLFTKSRESTLPGVLQGLEADEVAFLKMFCQDDHHLEAADPKSQLIPFRIYRACYGLARKEVISHRTPRRSVESFELLPDVPPALESVLGLRIKKPIIELDLSRVEGSNASGGGASGSYR